MECNVSGAAEQLGEGVLDLKKMPRKRTSGAKEAAEKVIFRGAELAGAKARRRFWVIFGTTEVVP
jgi:hypothetical protein